MHGHDHKYPKTQRHKRIFLAASTWPYWKQVKGLFRFLYDALAIWGYRSKKYFPHLSFSFYQVPRYCSYPQGALCLEMRHEPSLL